MLAISPAGADSVTVKAGAGGISDITARWLEPGMRTPDEMEARDRIALAIGMLISGGPREGYGESGAYHADPAEIWHARRHMRWRGSTDTAF